MHRPQTPSGAPLLIVGTKMSLKISLPRRHRPPYLMWQKINWRVPMTILHANYLVEPVCTIFYFHAPIWEFAHECSHCSRKAENAGA